MIPETHSEINPGTRPRLRMKWDSFLTLTAALGCETDVARAKRFDLDLKTLRNLRAGGPAGDKTVAKVLTVAEANGYDAEFDSFFEVIVDAA